MIAFAWIALLSWPLVALALFRRLSVPVAVCVTIVGGYLILPEWIGYDPPLLPRLDKASVAMLSALVLGATFLDRARAEGPVPPGWLPREPVALALVGLLALGALGTTLTNGDTLYIGWRVLRGLRLYDSAATLLQILVMLGPFLLARRVLATPEAQRVLILTIAVAALVYSLPTLWEVRMSPQLHRQIYGIQPFSFVQQMRQDGFRPVVFLNHGLSLGIFMCLGVLAVAGLSRLVPVGNRAIWGLAVAWLGVTLVLAKSIGALLIALVLLPVALIVTPRTQLLVATGIAVLVLAYPAARAVDIVPVDSALELAGRFSAERAASLEVRIENEDRLLAHARERPLFGWGDWGRNRVYDASGIDISISDGAWVIIFGVGGWVRYIGTFGLLCWPIIAIGLRRNRDGVDAVAALLALLLSAKLLDLIPNSGLDTFLFLMAGSLLGRYELARAGIAGTAASGVQAAAAKPGRGGSASRFPAGPSVQARRPDGDPAPRRAASVDRDTRARPYARSTGPSRYRRR